MERVRLDKFLADQGLASRKELREIILPMCRDTEACHGHEQAYEKALSELDSGSALVIFGSLYLASDMRRIILDHQEKEKLLSPANKTETECQD